MCVEICEDDDQCVFECHYGCRCDAADEVCVNDCLHGCACSNDKEDEDT